MQYAIPISEIDLRNKTFPLKEHSQLPCIIDILSRQNNHHIIMHGCLSDKFRFSLIEAIALHLTIEPIPKKLNHATLIYFDVRHFFLGRETPEEIIDQFNLFIHDFQSKNSLIICILNDSSIFETQSSSPRLETLAQLLKSKLMDPQWRIVAFSSSQTPHLSYLQSFFTLLRLNEPTYNEMLAIVKTLKVEIENFHQVLIPDEIFSYALSLTSHYLGGKSSLDKIVELLDSGAARASIEENSILTASTLAKVASNWSQIPLSYLHHNKFKLIQFIQHMQKKILGQDTAINTIGALLQTTCINLKDQSGPICNLLLTGPTGVGKNEFCRALSEYLFYSTESLFYIVPHQHPVTCLSEIFVTIRSDKVQHLPLLEAIQTKPYAIICFENINENSVTILELFKEMFMQGYAFDKFGNTYDFRHAIIIINTTLGAEKIKQLAQHHNSHSQKTMDLMQLILNEGTNSSENYHYLSQQEIHDQILPCLTNLPQEIVRHLHIVPFIPLDQNSLEKIIQLKIQSFAKTLENELGIILSYAPEVVKFLLTQTLQQHNNAESLTMLFEQHIHSSIANEMLARIDDKNRPNKLVMLLNESGQMLRCEFLKTYEDSTS